MRIRDGDNASIDLARLQLFCLDPKHPRGAHKARQFAIRLGFTTRDAETLRDRLQAAISSSVEGQAGARDAFGQRYTLDVEITGPKGMATVRSIWITRAGDPGPRLLTCYVL